MTPKNGLVCWPVSLKGSFIHSPCSLSDDPDINGQFTVMSVGLQNYLLNRRRKYDCLI